MLSKTGKVIIAAVDAGVQLNGDPVSDWQIARARLHGSTELEEIFAGARLVRLFRATDALATNAATAIFGPDPTTQPATRNADRHATSAPVVATSPGTGS